MSNIYGLSDGTLAELRENNPELYRELTRPAAILHGDTCHYTGEGIDEYQRVLEIGGKGY